MTESIEKGNFVLKLEAFFTSCILEGWKDTIVTLQMTAKLPEWSENLGIIRRCIDSVVEKILTPPAKVIRLISIIHDSFIPPESYFYTLYSTSLLSDKALFFI